LRIDYFIYLEWRYQPISLDSLDFGLLHNMITFLQVCSFSFAGALCKRYSFSVMMLFVASVILG